MKRKWLVVGIFLLFVGTIMIPATAHTPEEPLSTSKGSWLYVGGSGPGNYTKIQDAIDNTNEGDTVFVFDDSSPYFEQLKINKSISLLGEKKETTIIDSNNTGTTITLYSNKIRISGFTIQNSGLRHASGIFAGPFFSNITVDNVIIQNHDYGIRFNYITDLFLHDDVFKTNEHGIYLNYCTHGTITRNIIMNNEEGIGSFSESISISFNLFHDNGEAVFLYDGDFYANVFNNVFENNSGGLELGGSGSTIQKNSFSNNSIGLYISDGVGCKIIKNNFINNENSCSFSYSTLLKIIALFLVYFGLISFEAIIGPTITPHYREKSMAQSISIFLIGMDIFFIPTEFTINGIPMTCFLQKSLLL